MSKADKDFGIILRAPGGPEALEWGPLDIASPGPGEVLIAHRAIGVNYIDTYFRTGLYSWPQTPMILGSEAAGVIAAIGAEVKDLKVGDRVAYCGPPGAYRLRRVMNAERVVKLPDSVDFDTAASVMLGLLLGQGLTALGAQAIGTVGSPETADVARSNGYAHASEDRNENFV